MAASASENQVWLQRHVILAMLLALAAAAWSVIVWHDHPSMDITGTSPTNGLRVVLLLVMWAVMMVAMMLPSAAPMILAQLPFPWAAGSPRVH